MSTQGCTFKHKIQLAIQKPYHPLPEMASNPFSNTALKSTLIYSLSLFTLIFTQLESKAATVTFSSSGNLTSVNGGGDVTYGTPYLEIGSQPFGNQP